MHYQQFEYVVIHAQTQYDAQNQINTHAKNGYEVVEFKGTTDCVMPPAQNGYLPTPYTFTNFFVLMRRWYNDPNNVPPVNVLKQATPTTPRIMDIGDLP